MAGELETVPLGSLCTRITKGTTPTTLGGRFTDHGINFIKSESITSDGRIDASKFAFVDPETHASLGRSILHEGDVLFSMAGVYLGKTAVVPRNILPANTNQAVGIIRVDRDRAVPRFVHYVLSAPTCRGYVQRSVAQSAQPNFNLRDIGDLPIPVKSLSEQRATAHILGTLDDKIELNRRRNATLEAMARALFKAWFVDFEPVRAKLEGRWHRGQSLPGLPAHLYDLFPDHLVDSELGEIPEGWSAGKFGQIVRQLKEPVNPGESPKAMFAHYSLPAFEDSQSPVFEAGEAIKSNKWRVEPGTVLLSKLNPEIDRTWFVDVRGDAPAVCSTEFLVLAARKPFVRSFLYSIARSDHFRQQLESLVTGTSKSHQRAQPLAVMDMDVVLPSEAAVAAFEHPAEGWLTQIQANRRESRTLATLRDTLLPKLISGELRVPETSRLVGEVT